MKEMKIDGRCAMHTLEAGTVKCVYIDRKAAAKGEPCWMVYLPNENQLYRMKEGNTLNAGPLSVRFCGHKDKPLMPDGPAYWVETTAAIEIRL